VPNKFHRKNPDDALALDAALCSAARLFSLRHDYRSAEGAETFIPDATVGISGQHANYVLIPLPPPFEWSAHIFKTTPTGPYRCMADLIHGGGPYSSLIRRVQEPATPVEVTKMPQADHVLIIAVRH
jgi:hypothetical protein